MKLCPVCESEMSKCIYVGLPGRFCIPCSVLTGMASYAPPISTETDSGPMFSFFIYQGSYLLALWHWLTHWSGTE